MDRQALFWAGLALLGGFGGAAAGVYIFSPHASVTLAPLAPMAPTSEATFKPAAPSTPEEDATAERIKRQFMETFRTGAFSDAEISENSDDAPPSENHAFFNVIADYNGIDRWRPGVSGKIACIAERRNGATVHTVAYFSETSFESHVASLNEWVFGGCSDRSHIGLVTGTTAELDALRYLQTRRSLLPATPAYAQAREALTAEIKKHNFFGFLGN